MDNGNKIICLAGKNDIAVDVLLHCLQTYNNTIKCIVNSSDKGINSWQKSLLWFAKKYNIEIVTLDDIYDIENLVFISLEFDKIIKPEKFKTKELYNIHFSLLPEYKGMYTSVLPILHGKSYTGVTLHKINCGIDTGEIIAQEKIIIKQEDTAYDLYKKMIKKGTELVITYFDVLLKGCVSATPQRCKGSTYYSKEVIDYSNLQLNVNSTADQIKNQIRAFSFRPYQLLKWNDASYIECKILDTPSVKKPGNILEETDLYVKLSTIDYDIKLYKDVFQDLLKAIAIHDNVRALYLYEANTLLSAKEEHGWTALTVAVYNNNFFMVKQLIKRRADICVTNNNGTTLLMYAKDCFVNYGDSRIFEYLIGQGMDINIKDYYGKNLFDYCKEQGIEKIGNYELNKSEVDLGVCS